MDTEGTGRRGTERRGRCHWMRPHHPRPPDRLAETADRLPAVAGPDPRARAAPGDHRPVQSRVATGCPRRPCCSPPGGTRTATPSNVAWWPGSNPVDRLPGVHHLRPGHAVPGHAPGGRAHLGARARDPLVRGRPRRAGRTVLRHGPGRRARCRPTSCPTPSATTGSSTPTAPSARRLQRSAIQAMAGIHSITPGPLRPRIPPTSRPPATRGDLPRAPRSPVEGVRRLGGPGHAVAAPGRVLRLAGGAPSRPTWAPTPSRGGTGGSAT